MFIDNSVRQIIISIMMQVAVQLPDDLGRFVEQSIASGDYHNTEEFFISVLANLKEQAETEITEPEAQHLAKLRADLQFGVDQLDSGKAVKNLDWDAFLAERHRNFDSRQAVG